jgi:hypothetical protein
MKRCGQLRAGVQAIESTSALSSVPSTGIERPMRVRRAEAADVRKLPLVSADGW